MKFKIETTVEFHPIKLVISAAVRYWEDATVNGREDKDGTLIPFRKGNTWNPIIEIKTGRVLDWPQGTEANVHYKVCDAGEYWLEDTDGRRAKQKGEYVPDDVGGDGYGDYIILKIDKDGIIHGWNPKLDADDWALESD